MRLQLDAVDERAKTRGLEQQVAEELDEGDKVPSNDERLGRVRVVLGSFSSRSRSLLLEHSAKVMSKALDIGELGRQVSKL